MRLGFNLDSLEANDRTPGSKVQAGIPGTRCVGRTKGLRKTYEIAIPLRLLKSLKAGEGGRLILDLSFPTPENAAESMESPEPNMNTFSYRVRYGNDSLVPVHFVELNLQRKR